MLSIMMKLDNRIVTPGGALPNNGTMITTGLVPLAPGGVRLIVLGVVLLALAGAWTASK